VGEVCQEWERICFCTSCALLVWFVLLVHKGGATFLHLVQLACESLAGLRFLLCIGGSRLLSPCCG
jgi:hypothetical protein